VKIERDLVFFSFVRFNIIGLNPLDKTKQFSWIKGKKFSQVTPHKVLFHSWNSHSKNRNIIFLSENVKIVLLKEIVSFWLLPFMNHFWRKILSF